MKATVELYGPPLQGNTKKQNTWRAVAEFEVRAESEIKKGYSGSGFLTYDVDYALAHMGRKGCEAVSCRYPVGMEMIQEPHWPAFLLDLLPSGANRRYWLVRLGLNPRKDDGPQADWTLLLNGASNPPGNLRIAEASHSAQPPHPTHSGFTYKEVVDRAEHFIEYAQAHGAPIAGSTGAQGDAPKFLLSEDAAGRWHADGALPDELAVKHWLVKFPRGKDPLDLAVLKNEGAYYKVARALGLHVGEMPRFEKNVLFVPRFDRSPTQKSVTNTAGLDRLGLESLASLAGIADFGVRTFHEELCAAIAKYVTDPAGDLMEYVLRDFANVLLGNTDNHSRNTSLLKYPDGRIALSPLYDFAPMILDPEGISRVCRWGTPGAEEGGLPNWSKVIDIVAELGAEKTALKARITQFTEKLEGLPSLLRKSGVDQDLIQRLQGRIEDAKKATRG